MCVLGLRVKPTSYFTSDGDQSDVAPPTADLSESEYTARKRLMSRFRVRHVQG